MRSEDLAFPDLADALPLLGLLLLAAGCGFALALCLYSERLRRAEWRLGRAEQMCASLREVCDDYRRRLGGRSPQQAQKRLEEQQRKLSLLGFQVANLTSELKSLRQTPTSDGGGEIIDLTESRKRGSQRG